MSTSCKDLRFSLRAFLTDCSFFFKASSDRFQTSSSLFVLVSPDPDSLLSMPPAVDGATASKPPLT